MKKIILMLSVCSVFQPCAYADYYRASGGGVYELYVDDCSAAGMRRALDNAVTAKKAVITTVKCVPRPQPVADAYDTVIEYAEMDWPVVDVCPCSLECDCGC